MVKKFARSIANAMIYACASLLVAAPAALGHHSFAMFDFSKSSTLGGTVKEFRWTNPHVILIVTDTPKPGEVGQDWTLELTSPGNLTRLGWSRHAFKPGDRVDLIFNPLRDGKHGGAFEKATLLDTGQVYTANYRDAEKPELK